MSLKVVNPLLAYWRPKDLPKVLKGIEELPCDKIFANYYNYPHNYNLTRNFFLENPEYTHYIALPNDLVPTRKIYDKLIEHIKIHDYPVVAGCCNVDLRKYKNHLNVCWKLPEVPYIKRHYRWMAESIADNMINKGEPVHRVGFAGFPLMFIRRDIIEKIPFGTIPYPVDERPIWETRGGFGGDLAFCTSCKYYDIPVMVDLTCKMEHLRFEGEMLIGKKPPSIEFIRNNQVVWRHESEIKI